MDRPPTLCSRLFCQLALMCLLLALLCTMANAQKVDSPTNIELRKPIQRDIAGAQVHSYRLVLPASQFARLTIEQRRTDVSISLFGADGQFITTHDLTSSGEAESISLLAESATTYRLNLRATDTSGPGGSYTITMNELRAATERDKTLVAAERLFSTAMQLSAEQKEESRRRALEKLEQVRALSHSINDTAAEARTLYKMAEVHLNLGEIQKAFETSERGLPLAQAAGDRKTQADLLDTIGLGHDGLGDRKKSLEFFNQALSFRDDTDRLGKAHTLTNIGAAYGWIGDRQKAIDYFTQVLSMLRELRTRRPEGAVLNNLCVVHTDMGEYQKALQFCNQSLLIRRELKDTSAEGSGLNSLGNVYSHLGDYQKALDAYLQSLAIYKKLGERDGEAYALNNVGFVYNNLGEYDKAHDYYQQALNLIKAKGDKYAILTLLGNIGVNYAEQEDFKKALDFYLQGLPLTRDTKDTLGEAIALSNIGGAYSNLGDDNKALEFYTQSLELFRKAGNPRNLIVILRNVGDQHVRRGEYQKALDYFNEALALSRSTGDPNNEAASLSVIAKLERKRGNLKEALKFIEQALTTIESIRINLKSAQFRASYFATVRKFFEFNIAVLMDLHKAHPLEGFDAAALQVSEKSRARSLLGLLKEARTEIRQGVDPLLIERERKLRVAIADKAVLQRRLLSGRHTDEQRLASEKELGDMTTEHEQVQAQIRATSPRYAALIEPVPLGLKQIQSEVLDDDTLLLEYSLGEERSFLWTVGTSSIKGVELPKRSDVEQVARQLYDALTARNQAGYHDSAARLSQMILAPVASELKNKRLVIVSEGILQHVPFAVLPSPASSAQTDVRSLIADHEIVNLPSASVLGLLRHEATGRKLPTKTVIVFADPVFSQNDERIASRQRRTDGATTQAASFEDVKRSATESGLADLVRLRFSRQEADAIAKLAAENMKLKAVDFAASRGLATSDELSQYRIVHFATHGLINNQYPELSGVVLSLVDENGQAQNGFLRLYDIYNLKLTADLVVLSACQTALGKEIRGEGIVGLTRGFMYAGSPRVVASLWQTDDRATAVLMQRFYTLMLRDQLRPAAALRAAQISMSREPRWQSPQYWAAFTLQGEWK